MPVSLILYNVPDEVYKRLSAAAALHRRSVNNEATAILVAALMPETVNAGERLARASTLRAELLEGSIRQRDVDAHKWHGRA